MPDLSVVSVLRISLLLPLLFGLSSSAFSQSTGKHEAKSEMPEMEFYPRHLRKRLERHYALLDRAKLTGPNATRGVYSPVHLWPLPKDVTKTPERINVCFFDGKRRYQKMVIAFAGEWKKAWSAVPLDFGQPGVPRKCTGKGGNEHIRISFKEQGTWSAVGWQSMVNALFPPNEPSMNFGFKISQISRSRFRRAVLHEFGHALGLEHEHQNGYLDCWKSEFDKPKLKSFLRRERGWGLSDIRYNLRLLLRRGTAERISTPPDRHSVMLYGFPAKYYHRGTQSNCYAPEVAAISDGDKVLIRKLYPRTSKARQMFNEERLALMKKTLKDGPVTRSLSKQIPMIDKFIPGLDLSQAGEHKK